jgi:hypothetical protein
MERVMDNQNRINSALESIAQVRSVNNLIQGICSRLSAAELSEQEASGMWVLLEWQNERLKRAEQEIKQSIKKATVLAAA